MLVNEKHQNLHKVKSESPAMNSTRSKIISVYKIEARFLNVTKLLQF